MHVTRTLQVSVIACGIMWTAGCATGEHKPRVSAYPAKGQSEAQVALDEKQCKEYAKKESNVESSKSETAKGAGKGAVIGAAIGTAAGVVIGAAAGSPGTGAAVGAAAGGTGGAVVGGAVANKETKDAYDRAYTSCMKARGYQVEGR